MTTLDGSQTSTDKPEEPQGEAAAQAAAEAAQAEASAAVDRDAAQAEAAQTALVLGDLGGLPNKTQYNAVVTWGKLFAASGYFKDAKTAAQAAVKIMFGTELGFSVGASMAGVHIIEGKPTLAAHLQAQKVKTSGKYDYQVIELDDLHCTIAWFQRGPGGWAKLAENTFTIEHARRAELLGRTSRNWERYPSNMLFARALTNGIRFYCPDIFTAGPVYTPDELSDEVELTESGDVRYVETITVEPGRVGIEEDGPPAAARPAQPQQQGRAQQARQQERPQQQERPRQQSATPARSSSLNPARPEDIDSVGGLLMWTRTWLKARNVTLDGREVLALYGVELPAELREKYGDDWQKAAAIVMERYPDESVIAALTPDQRAIYDEVIAGGGTHSDALVLASSDDEDDIGAEQEAEGDDADAGAVERGGAPEGEPEAGPPAPDAAAPEEAGPAAAGDPAPPASSGA